MTASAGVDTRTACLTDQGWKGAAELKVGDMALALDQGAGVTRWSPVLEVWHTEHAVYREWVARQFIIATTDDHPWVVRTRDTGEDRRHPYRRTTAVAMGRGDGVPRIECCGDLPPESWLSDDFVELMAWVACEGHYRHAHRTGNGIIVSQKTHMDRVKALMNRLGVAPGYLRGGDVHTWEFGGDLAKTVRRVAPGRAPQVKWLASLTQRQLRLFLDVCTLADGSVAAAVPGVHRERTTFRQKPGPILDSWLAACALAGQPVSRGSASSPTESTELWSVRRSGLAEVRYLQAGPYRRGPVWCPITTLGTFVARRDAAVFISGTPSVRVNAMSVRPDGGP